MKQTVHSVEEMRTLAKAVALGVHGGQVIELVGDVGAGKTTFVKGFAEGLGIDEDVQSPSFTISRVYDAPSGVRLAHYDFYRLSDPGIMKVELAEAVSDAATITVIEWAGVVDGILPAHRLSIHITPLSDTDREVTIEVAS